MFETLQFSTKLHSIPQFLTANLLDHELNFLVCFRVQKSHVTSATWQSHLTLRTRQLLLSPPLRNENCRFVTMAPAWRNVFSTYCGVNCDSRLWYYFCLAVWWRKQLLSSLESTMYCYCMGLAIPRKWHSDFSERCINWPQSLLTGGETGMD